MYMANTIILELSQILSQLYSFRLRQSFLKQELLMPASNATQKILWWRGPRLFLCSGIWCKLVLIFKIFMSEVFNLFYTPEHILHKLWQSKPTIKVSSKLPFPVFSINQCTTWCNIQLPVMIPLLYLQCIMATWLDTRTKALGTCL